MAASDILGLNYQLPGSNVNLWGQILNDEVAKLLEEKVAGVKPIPLTGSKTLTSTNFVSNESRQAVLVFSNGGISAPATITVPAKQGVWLMVNGCGQTLTFSCGSGATGSVPTGRRAWVWCDGSNVFVFDPKADVILSEQAAAESAGNAAESEENAAGSAQSAAGSAGAASGSATAAANALTAINAKFIISTQPPNPAVGADGAVWFTIA